MLNKLEAIKARFDQVGVALTNPEIINNQKEFESQVKAESVVWDKVIKGRNISAQ